MRAIAIIPARYDSTRFKGKPLADLCGRPMLWWVYHQVKKARRLAEVWVATDHPAIQEACGAYQIPCKLTSPQCPTSTQRVWEAAQSLEGDVYVFPRSWRRSAGRHREGRRDSGARRARSPPRRAWMWCPCRRARSARGCRGSS